MTLALVTPSASAVHVRSLNDAIAYALGDASILDLSFPFASLWTGDAACVQAIAGTHSLHEREFLSRFRQAGGHLPIQSIDPGGELASTQSDKKIVIGLASLENASRVKALVKRRWPLIVSQAPTARLGTTAISALTDGFAVVRIAERTGKRGYVLLVPRETLVRDADIVLDDTLRTMTANTMIHDGRYASEGDAGYSWLWTGPEPHFRIILPHLLGRRPKRIEVGIPRSEDADNLSRIGVQIDGRPVRHTLEHWSSTSGKIIVDVPPRDDYSVLTLIVPNVTQDTGSGRLIGVCIDRLELSL